MGAGGEQEKVERKGGIKRGEKSERMRRGQEKKGRGGEGSETPKSHF